MVVDGSCRLRLGLRPTDRGWQRLATADVGWAGGRRGQMGRPVTRGIPIEARPVEEGCTRLAEVSGNRTSSRVLPHQASPPEVPDVQDPRPYMSRYRTAASSFSFSIAGVTCRPGQVGYFEPGTA